MRHPLHHQSYPDPDSLVKEKMMDEPMETVLTYEFFGIPYTLKIIMHPEEKANWYQSPGSGNPAYCDTPEIVSTEPPAELRAAIEEEILALQIAGFWFDLLTDEEG